MSIPLVQEATKDAINTSIIAIKRNIERINMLLGLVDNDSPDLSGFATKQELQDAVTELQPVDEVTVGNMHSVTSNAVAERFINTDYINSICMYPRYDGIRLTSNQFLSMISDPSRQSTPACCGSISLVDGPAGDAWYTYLYLPHRTGIGGDNYLWGTVIIFGMTVVTSTFYINHLYNGIWQGWRGNG